MGIIIQPGIGVTDQNTDAAIACARPAGQFKQMLRLVCRGCSGKQTATALDVSAFYSKLDVHKRGAAKERHQSRKA